MSKVIEKMSRRLRGKMTWQCFLFISCLLSFSSLYFIIPINRKGSKINKFIRLQFVICDAIVSPLESRTRLCF